VILTAWRITKRSHVRNAFNGSGARKYGGRWNSPGTSVVYTAQSQSLAALEILVHLDNPDLLQKYVLIGVAVDESLVAEVSRSRLPRNWRTDPPRAELRLIGDQWAADATSAVLRVPSALVPDESNFLLNPLHPDFGRLVIGKPISFRFDPRLAR
jgi:RES domain-containing protein